MRPSGTSRTERRVVAIHQPNFFPWLGYFQKIARADVFVILDDVQFPKTGGTWLNRVRLLVAGGAAWCTMPVVRAFSGVRTVSEMRIDDQAPWRAKMARTMEASYGRAPCFGEVFPSIADLIDSPTGSVAGFNLSAIRSLTASLALDPSKLVLASSLASAGRATDRLISIVRAVGGTTYLSGDGAGGYQDEEQFHAAGIELVHQRFQHPVYPQAGVTSFISGLSIVDALMSRGFDGTRALLDESEAIR